MRGSIGSAHGVALRDAHRARPGRRWHRPATFAVVCAVALAAVVASAARGATLAASTPPLAGSSFQGGDGNQDDQPPNLVDWQGLQSTGRVVHSADPNAADSAFAGGAKEDKPGAWDLTTESGGVKPGKDNILDAWSAVDQPGASTFLYLAFTREEANGTTVRDVRAQPRRAIVGQRSGADPVPAHGRLLVVFAAHGQGMDVVLERWTTTATDAATGCATTGSLDAGGERSCGRRSGRGQSRSRSSITCLASTRRRERFPTGQFGEAALNLSALLEAAFDDRCFAFGSIWMHSRSSTSESSQMQDYVARQQLAVRTCTASGTKFFDLNANGQRDAGEPGIPRFLIWADYDDDGMRDASEPFTVTDDDGRYVLDDIRAAPAAATRCARRC